MTGKCIHDHTVYERKVLIFLKIFISELTFPSTSIKTSLVMKPSHENVFPEQVQSHGNQTHVQFSERFCTSACFKTDWLKVTQM